MKRFILSRGEELILQKLVREHVNARHDRGIAEVGVTKCRREMAEITGAHGDPWRVRLDLGIHQTQLAVARETIRLTSELIHMLREI